jgi:hypothetical protein
MAKDATAILKERMLSQVGPTVADGIDSNSTFLTNVTSLVGSAANYAQLLGGAEGVIGEVTAAIGLTISTGAGAGLVLFVALAFAALSDSSESPEAEYHRLEKDISDLNTNVAALGLANYWQTRFQGLDQAWNSPEGGLGTDLDDLANENLGGFYVKQDAPKYHDHALTFVNVFLPPSPGAETYWERPVLANEGFDVQPAKYWPPGNPMRGWYGTLPQPKSASQLGGPPAQMAIDPRTMMPFLLLGLESYLALQMLVHSIDPTQPTFDEFVKEFRTKDLPAYAEFLTSQYELAVNGIVKSDLPGPQDLIGFVNDILNGGVDFGFTYPTSSFHADFADVTPTAGQIWNGVYGAVDTYPLYGFYQPEPPVPVPIAGPAFVIEFLDTATVNLYDEWSYAGVDWGDPGAAESILETWILPWLEDKLILARMARWKAIYLLNAYERVWETIQLLRLLAGAPLSAPKKLDPDHTRADGNWSLRELVSILNFDGDILYGFPLGHGIQVGGGYSVRALAWALYNIGNGNWGGPPDKISGPLDVVPAGSNSLRDTLALVAV